MPSVTCHTSTRKKKKVVKLIEEGSVIKKAYPAGLVFDNVQIKADFQMLYSKGSNTNKKSVSVWVLSEEGGEGG